MLVRMKIRLNQQSSSKRIMRQTDNALMNYNSYGKYARFGPAPYMHGDCTTWNRRHCFRFFTEC
ncbi:protein of unknown function [Candidatus Filomicrobium marinum]|uniref:Uncharacterized protein n=2 Tax=Filomicrobium TaxID=119044 RepID=A0A0D6JAK5_9HYPH|nr:protein of unknown function [Candidatus Filomicrobium marinum]CPR14747.1 protein of unknown function [Candidatus Filomicrobium marinum]SDO76201.1 hypothetical protein SAMN04488061_1588 [Filomicrobium insigne]